MPPQWGRWRFALRARCVQGNTAVRLPFGNLIVADLIKFDHEDVPTWALRTRIYEKHFQQVTFIGLEFRCLSAYIHLVVGRGCHRNIADWQNCRDKNWNAGGRSAAKPTDPTKNGMHCFKRSVDNRIFHVNRRTTPLGKKYGKVDASATRIGSL